jgi:TPR repeat protein
MYDHGEGVPVSKANAACWYERAADENHADAQVALGMKYEHGDGVAVNPTMARTWYARAALQEHSVGEVCLGLLCYNKQDYPGAVGWFGRAARRGDGRALYNLAVMTANGLGIAPDQTRADQLFQQAAAAGDEAAKTYLASR